DGWDVQKEFALLRTALKPVAKYLMPEFCVAGDKRAFGKRLQKGVAVVHYAGHCDFDPDGSAYLVREVPKSGLPELAKNIYVNDLAASLRKLDLRLVVMSSCNSGFWPVVEPLLEAGVPAVIGINGSVKSESAIEFCEKLYESLCLGLTLDE